MCIFVVTLSCFKIAKYVAMETMQFHITEMDLFLRNIFLSGLIGPFDINYRNAPSGSI